jgi:hypothetical protein
MQTSANGSLRMQQVGSFVSSYSNETNNTLPRFQLHENKQIMWVNGIPRAEPECGFSGCPNDWSFILSCIFVILFVALVSAFLIKLVFFYSYSFVLFISNKFLTSISFL